jgi:hypothetical protein
MWGKINLNDNIEKVIMSSEDRKYYNSLLKQYNVWNPNNIVIHKKRFNKKVCRNKT